MGLPAELYFSEDKKYPTTTHVQPATPTFVEVSPIPCLDNKIKIIGIGGGGSNALNHIISTGTENVGFLALETDVRNLEKSSSNNKIILGNRGIGAGCVPQRGEEGARESLPEIMKFMQGADMVYLTAGMGGGTGTGAIPVIAEAARNLGILTVAVVTKPFAFEGIRKMRIAEEGIERLKPVVDALIVIPNEKLLENCDPQTAIPEAFAMADEVLRQAVLGVTELITKPGMVNMDFADVKAVMQKSGVAVMGTGCAVGENRIADALKQAMESPLMEIHPSEAKGVLMNITSAGTLTLFELQAAAEALEECIGEDTAFVWGTAEDSELGEKVKITIIATGMAERRTMTMFRKQEHESEQPVQQPEAQLLFPMRKIQPQVLPEETIDTNTHTQMVAPQKTQGTYVQPVQQEDTELSYVQINTPKRQINTETQETFIPAWLRTKTQEKEQSSMFSGNNKYDLPSFIRRKKTAPKID